MAKLESQVRVHRPMTSCSATMTKWQKPDYKEFCDLPSPKRISAEEFAQSHFFIWKAVKHFSAYVETDGDDVVGLHTKGMGDRTWIMVNAFEMHDGTGYAIKNDYWKKKLYFWTFAPCRHEHKTCRNVGNCLNTYTCQDCGYSETIDSSD